MALDVKRVAAVAVALAGVGAAVGAVLGSVLAAGLMLVPPRVIFWEGVVVGAEFGAAVGAVLAPIAAFSLMRRVPIWRAIAETAVGTMVGAGIGLVLQPYVFALAASPMVLGIVGFAVAALRLRLSQGTRLAASAYPRIEE